MGILTGILMFIFFSIVAACDGDWSGIEVIIKFVAGFALFALVLYLMTQPVLILVCIIVAVVLGVAKSKKYARGNNAFIKRFFMVLWF